MRHFHFVEEFWLSADSIDDFTQQEPDNMAPPRERTVIQVAYDDRFLYVAARCYARDASTISAGLGGRGSIPASDKMGIALDPSGVFAGTQLLTLAIGAAPLEV